MNDFLNELATLDQLATARNDFAKSLALVRALKSGAVKLDDVTLTADGWQVAAVTSPLPETITEQAEPGA